MEQSITGYNVYYAADGCAEVFMGFAEDLFTAEEIAEKDPAVGLEASLYATAKKAGHCDGLYAPETEHEDEDSAIWISEDTPDMVAIPIVE